MQTPSPSHTAHSGGESPSITRLVQIEIGVHEKQFGIIVGHTILAERITNAIDRHSAQLETECAALQKRVGELQGTLFDSVTGLAVCAKALKTANHCMNSAEDLRDTKFNNARDLVSASYVAARATEDRGLVVLGKSSTHPTP